MYYTPTEMFPSRFVLVNFGHKFLYFSRLGNAQIYPVYLEPSYARVNTCISLYRKDIFENFLFLYTLAL